MTQFLPPNLLALFAPRDPIPYLPPLDKLPHEKKQVPYGGVTQLLAEFEDPKDTPPPTRVETRDERKERKRKERAEQHAYKLEQDLALWDPATNPAMTSDPYKTLFVARINYDTSESKLRREFETYGPVRRIKLLTNTNNSKPRGYAFIEYEHERDMHSAYKHADGKKIDGRRVLVDVERARTVKGWRPRRLGGGLGGTRKGGPDVNTKYSGRDDNFGAGMRDDHDDERSRSREREPRPERRRRRSRSGSVEEQPRRRRSRSKDNRERPERPERAERERPERAERPRRKRSRSRERRRSKERRRSGSREGGGSSEGGREGGGSREGGREGSREGGREGGREERAERKRSRSRDRKRRRSRSKERTRRSRSRERRQPEEGAEPGAPFNQEEEFPEIKQEPDFEEARYGHGPDYQPNGEENYQREYAENYDDESKFSINPKKVAAESEQYGEYPAEEAE